MNLIASLLNNEVASESAQKIYTTSYYDQDVANLTGLLKDLDAILIDIRFIPDSKPIKWSRDYLKLLLKRKYLHVPHLGNRADKKSGRISIQNLSLGLKIIKELQVNLVLMCGCEKEENCHRQQIAEKLREQGRDVREITDWRPPNISQNKKYYE